ncbi:hypothetical protein [Maricaulis maris]|uniref:hypothetical protein n=1 Tax=Maricaulis maris TaxID=74318 RepID=UPI003A91A7A1
MLDLRVTGSCLVVALVMMLGGCTSTVRETHYFMSVNEETGQPVNFFRLQIKANTNSSSARYVAGFYDESAVDMYFNEIRLSQSNGQGSGDSGTEGRSRAPSENIQLSNITATGEQRPGAFMLILSSNADSVVNTISQFAQSRIVAEGVTNIVNRERLRLAAPAQAAYSISQREGNALATDITSQLEAITALAATSGTGNSDAMEQTVLSALQSLARQLGHTEAFAGADEAAKLANARLVFQGLYAGARQ